MYDLTTKKQVKFEINSNHSRVKTSPITIKKFNDPKKRITYAWTEAQFFPIKWDSTRSLFYRMYKKYTPLVTDGQEVTNYGTAKQFFLTILDEDFRVVNEIELPGYLLPEFVIGKDGLYFQLKHDFRENENSLDFYVLGLEDLIS